MYVFFKNRSDILVSIKNFKKQKVKELKSIGTSFFIIQICVLVILATDNILVIALLGPDEVTSYNNVFKLFQVFLIISTIIHAPLWPLYTNAYYNHDLDWIRATVRRLHYLLLLLVPLIILTIVFGPRILEAWIKEDIFYDYKLLLFMGLFVVIRIFGEIYITFLNSIGKIKTQLIISVIAAVINIPLSIIFVKFFELGSSGIILSTVISMSLYALVMPIQAISILKKQRT